MDCLEAANKVQQCITDGSGMNVSLHSISFSFAISSRNIPLPDFDKPGGRPYRKNYDTHAEFRLCANIYESNLAAWNKVRRANIAERRRVRALTKIKNMLLKLY